MVKTALWSSATEAWLALNHGSGSLTASSPTSTIASRGTADNDAGLDRERRHP